MSWMFLLLACSSPEPPERGEPGPRDSTPPVVETADTTTPTPTADTARTFTGDTAPPPPEPYVCPDLALYDTTFIERQTFNPCVLDPTVTLCATPPNVDTHSDGLRLHRMYRVTDRDVRDQLLLFIPPGVGNHNGKMMKWFAYAGYTSINLGWQTEPIKKRFDDELSWREFVYGDGYMPLGDIEEHDALMGRLDTLMAHLLTSQPKVGWDRWWTEKGGMNWADVVLVGWSDGASAAAYIARDHEVAGIVTISGPKDKAWIADPRLTPACAHRIFYHRGEGLDAKALAPVTAGIGIDPTEVDADAGLPPYDDAQVLTTQLTDFGADWCSNHQAMAMDECMHDDQFEPYLYLACTATEACKP